jgi:potassium-dependent mechanosensitive channel
MGWWRGVGLVGLLAGVATAATPATPATTTTLAPESVSAAALRPVPISQIASQAEDTVARLRTIVAVATPMQTVTDIETRMASVEARVSEATRETYRVLKQSPTLAALDGLLDPWMNVREQAKVWVNSLTARAEDLDALLKRLDGIRLRWIATRDAAPSSHAPEATLGRIDDTLVLIGSAHDRVAARRDQVLVLQDRAAQVLARTDEMLDQIQATRRALLGQIFVRDALPVWDIIMQSESWRSAGNQAGESIGGELPVLRLFAKQHGTSLFVEGVMFLGLGILFRVMRRRARRWTALDDTLVARFKPFEYPWASAALLSLLVASQTPPNEPRALQASVALVAMVPIIRMIANLLPREFASVIWVVGILHVIDLVRSLVSTIPPLEQVIFLVQLVALVLAVGWLRRHFIPNAADEDRRRRRAQIGYVVLLLASVALVAGAAGYLRLARAIEFALISAAQWALVLWALVRISDAIVAWALRVRPLRLLRAVQEHRAGLERSLQRVVHVLAVVFWAISLASILAILGPLTQRVTSVLEAHVGYGAVRFSLGDVLAFAVVVWVTFQLSVGVRAVLEEDVFARVSLGRGVAVALSSLVHYAILLVGFLLGLGALGIDLTRITILAGALGVGIGFGLQNVVNNFVSGLILLFERPIQVGDSVQLGTLTGEVKRIGIRSSTVRTFEGAEVIVPNASLVSDQVTNWTLSDRMRRIDLDIGIAYGTDPHRVMDLLGEVARSNPGVLPDPPPVVLFLGFGDSALNFQIRAWTARFEEWVRTRSDLGLAVQAALKAEGIDIPFPQRDVRIVREPDEAERPAALPESGGSA